MPYCKALPTTHKLGQWSKVWVGCPAHLETLTDHGSPSREGSLGPLVEVICWGHAQDGHLQPRVDVNAAWQDQQAMSIDGFDASRDNEVFSNLSESNTDLAGYKEPGSEHER